MQLRPAQSVEAPALTALAIRSKAHWGYDEAFLLACQQELTVTESRIASACWPCIVAVSLKPVNPSLVGFYLLSRKSEWVAELDALFVAPERIGTGRGRQLLEHALNVLRSDHIQMLEIQSDPGAKGFYERMGAQPIGHRASGSVPGRQLPLLQTKL